MCRHQVRLHSCVLVQHGGSTDTRLKREHKAKCTYHNLPAIANKINKKHVRTYSTIKEANNSANLRNDDFKSFSLIIRTRKEEMFLSSLWRIRTDYVHSTKETNEKKKLHLVIHTATSQTRILIFLPKNLLQRKNHTTYQTGVTNYASSATPLTLNNGMARQVAPPSANSAI